MITGVDHVVIAVRDLAAAVAAYERLGFEIAPGGRHPGSGTHNELIRFPLSFLELVSVHDEAEERAQSMGLSDILAQREGLAGFALRSDDIDADAARLRDAGLPVAGPIERSRMRDDGRTLRWKGIVVGDPNRPLGEMLWSSPLPFVIQWEGAAGGFEPPGRHANDAIETASVTVRAPSRDDALRAYAHGFGLPVEDGVVCCGPMRIIVVDGNEPGVESVEIAVAPGAATPDVAPREACGAHLRFVNGA
jgi:catechol 2,3-dioxygenase-like lactoylglutathione lyase family enzyme